MLRYAIICMKMELSSGGIWVDAVTEFLVYSYTVFDPQKHQSRADFVCLNEFVQMKIYKSDKPCFSEITNDRTALATNLQPRIFKVFKKS